MQSNWLLSKPNMMYCFALISGPGGN